MELALIMDRVSVGIVLAPLVPLPAAHAVLHMWIPDEISEFLRTPPSLPIAIFEIVAIPFGMAALAAGHSWLRRGRFASLGAYLVAGALSGVVLSLPFLLSRDLVPLLPMGWLTILALSLGNSLLSFAIFWLITRPDQYPADM